MVKNGSLRVCVCQCDSMGHCVCERLASGEYHFKKSFFQNFPVN